MPENNDAAKAFLEPTSSFESKRLSYIMKLMTMNFLGGKFQMRILAFRKNLEAYQSNNTNSIIQNDKNSDLNKITETVNMEVNVKRVPDSLEEGIEDSH